MIFNSARKYISKWGNSCDELICTCDFCSTETKIGIDRLNFEIFSTQMALFKSDKQLFQLIQIILMLNVISCDDCGPLGYNAINLLR